MFASFTDSNLSKSLIDMLNNYGQLTLLSGKSTQPKFEKSGFSLDNNKKCTVVVFLSQFYLIYSS